MNVNKNIKKELVAIEQSTITLDTTIYSLIMCTLTIDLESRCYKIGCYHIYLAQMVGWTTTFHLTIKCKHIYRAVQMTLNMQKQTKSNSTGNTDLIRYMARMFGKTNIIQIMLLMRHMLSIATQLPVTTTTFDVTTDLKKVFTEA